MTGFDIQHAMFQVYGIASTRDIYERDSISFGPLAARINKLMRRLRFRARGTS